VLVGLLSESTQGAADPNELLRIAAQIRAGNREEWVAAFAGMGERISQLASLAADRGNLQTASDSYCRAIACFRTGISGSRHPHE